MNFCTLDFETTGFSSQTCEVVEFAAVRVRDSEIDFHLASLCRPDGPIPLDAIRVHGITPEMVADSPGFAELLPTLLDFLGDDTVVCHNTPFDMSFLRRYCRDAGILYTPAVDDTLIWARRLYPHLPSRSLQPLAEHLGIESPGYHRALADAMVTAKLYLKMRAGC